MQEQRHNGPDVFKEDPTLKEFAEAVTNPDNKAVTIHPPGGRSGSPKLPEGSIVERWLGGRRVRFRVVEGHLVAA